MVRHAECVQSAVLRVLRSCGLDTCAAEFWTIGVKERVDASLGLAAIYGDLLHSACGWSWAELRESRGKRWTAMLAPSGTHALALMPYMQQQIPSEAPTVTLPFNMTVAGRLPPAEPGQLALIG